MAATNAHAVAGPVCRLDGVVEKLAGAALAEGTALQYAKTWQTFVDFIKTQIGQNPTLPIPPKDFARFIAWMFEQGLAPATIKARACHLAYYHRMKGFDDPLNNYFIKKILQGCCRLRPGGDTRLPITMELLQKIIGALAYVVPSKTLRITLEAMYLLAFHAFLRVGEITCTSSRARNPNLLLRKQIAFVGNPATTMSVTFTTFKHSNGSHPTTLHITALGGRQPDPVRAMEAYVQFTNHLAPEDPLFAYRGKPMTRAAFSDHLSKALRFMGMDPKFYKAHSFRIGAATTAALNGVSDQAIKAWGRWSSDAYRRYIRISVLNSTG